MESPHARRVAIAIFGCALAHDARSTFAGGPDKVADRCGTHLADFSKFQVCFGYPATAPPGVDCALFDFDGNGAVDLPDFAARSFVLRTLISVSPPRALITYSQTMDFDAAIAGSGNQSVNWSLRPVPGSEPGENLGTIDANGAYSPPPPSDLHAASQVVVEATITGLAPASEFACVMLFGTLTSGLPMSLVLPGSGGSGGIPSNVTTALPLVALVLPGPGDLGAMPINVTLAMPPVAIVLPGVGDPDALAPNTTVANPPVAVDVADSP